MVRGLLASQLEALVRDFFGFELHVQASGSQSLRVGVRSKDEEIRGGRRKWGEFSANADGPHAHLDTKASLFPLGSGPAG